jgi:hypothetical protein
MFAANSLHGLGHAPLGFAETMGSTIVQAII